MFSLRSGEPFLSLALSETFDSSFSEHGRSDSGSDKSKASLPVRPKAGEAPRMLAMTYWMVRPAGGFWFMLFKCEVVVSMDESAVTL